MLAVDTCLFVYIASYVKCSCRCENAVAMDTVTPTVTSSADNWSARVSSFGSSVRRSSHRVSLDWRRRCPSSVSRAISRSLQRPFRDWLISPGTDRPSSDLHGNGDDGNSTDSTGKPTRKETKFAGFPHGWKTMQESPTEMKFYCNVAIAAPLPAKQESISNFFR